MNVIVCVTADGGAPAHVRRGGCAGTSPQWHGGQGRRRRKGQAGSRYEFHFFLLCFLCYNIIDRSNRPQISVCLFLHLISIFYVFLELYIAMYWLSLL